MKRLPHAKLVSRRMLLSRAHVASIVLMATQFCITGSVPLAAAGELGVEICDGPTFRLAQQDNDRPPTPPTELPPASNDCQPFELEPLSSLGVDTEPVDRPGQIELTGDRPEDCFSYAVGELPTIYVGWGAGPQQCDFLQACCGWQFCHRPLYFEERCLERYGCRTCCCQPGASAIHFYSTALLLPIKMIQQPCCRASVRTPCY